MIDPRRRPLDTLGQDLVRRTIECIDNTDHDKTLETLLEQAWPNKSQNQ